MPTEPATKRSAALRRGRVSVASQVYLVTAVCAGRKAVFADEPNSNLAQRVLESESCWSGAEPMAWVLMPDHWHGLIRLRGPESLGQVVQRVKSMITKAIRKQPNSPEKTWQKGFHDHALRRDEGINEAIRYLLNNPVRAGLVEHWSQCQYRGGTHVALLEATDPLL